MSPELKDTLKQNNINIGVKNDIIYDYVPAPNKSNYFNIPNNYNGGSRKKRNIKRKKNIKSKRKRR